MGSVDRTSVHHRAAPAGIGGSGRGTTSGELARPGATKATAGLPPSDVSVKLVSSKRNDASERATRLPRRPPPATERSESEISRYAALPRADTVRATLSPKMERNVAVRAERRSTTPRRVLCHACAAGGGSWRSTWYSNDRYGPWTSRISMSAVATVRGSSLVSSSGPSGCWSGFARAYARATRGTVVSANTITESRLSRSRRYRRWPTRSASSYERSSSME